MADAAVTTGPKGTAPVPQQSGNFLATLVQFYHDVMAELRKVTWPEHGQVRSATIAIIIFVLVFALFIWLLDLALAGVLQQLIPSLFIGS